MQKEKVLCKSWGSFEEAVTYYSVYMGGIIDVCWALLLCVTEENRASRVQREYVHYAETPPI